MLSSARDLQLSYPFLFERWYPVPTELIYNAMRNGYRAIAIPAVELTLVPAAIAETAKRAKDMGAQIVMVHGELPLESVEPGTNLAAAKSPYAGSSRPTKP